MGWTSQQSEKCRAITPLCEGIEIGEWLYNGPEQAAPCKSEVNVPLCFPPLLKWLLSWWQGEQLALAINTTLHGDRVTAGRDPLGRAPT